MKITTVMDNKRGEQKSLIAEHGLSFLVETEKSQILFDFGAGKAAYDNACKLNIRMENIQYAVGKAMAIMIMRAAIRNRERRASLPTVYREQAILKKNMPGTA